MKVSWVKRYTLDKLDGHLANIIDEKLKSQRSNRNQVLIWGTDTLTVLVNSGLLCINSFFNVWLHFKSCFHDSATTTHNNLLHNHLFFDQWILRNPQVEDFSKDATTKKKGNVPTQDYGLY